MTQIDAPPSPPLSPRGPTAPENVSPILSKALTILSPVREFSTRLLARLCLDLDNEVSPAEFKKLAEHLIEGSGFDSDLLRFPDDGEHKSRPTLVRMIGEHLPDFVACMHAIKPLLPSMGPDDLRVTLWAIVDHFGESLPLATAKDKHLFFRHPPSAQS